MSRFYLIRSDMKDPLDEQDPLRQYKKDHHQVETVYHALFVVVDADHPHDGGQDYCATKDDRQHHQRLVILPQKVHVL